MAAYFCRDDKLGIPRPIGEELQKKCPLCGKTMEFYAFRSPSPDWQERIEGTMAMTVHAAEDSAQVFMRGDLAFVQDKTLRDLGYNVQLEAGDIVKLNGKYYELEGRDKKLNIWWVTHFDVEAYLRRNVHPLRVTRGPSSDDIIWYDEAGTIVYYNERTGEFVYGEAPES